MSEIKSSWSFVEITPEAREAAERAALAAGMDIDAWLAQLIKYTSAMELKVSEPRPAPRPQSPAPPSLGQQPAAQPPTPASFGQQASAPQLRGASMSSG